MEMHENPRAAVRRMELSDLDEIMYIEERSFATPWSRQSMTDEIANKAACYFVVEADGKIVAYAGAWLVIDEAHITNIAVHPDYRGRGYGKLVTRAVLEYAASVDMGYALLEVRVSNRRAICLYKQLGFKVLAIRKRYYEDNGEDAYVMLCELEQSPGI